MVIKKEVKVYSTVCESRSLGLSLDEEKVLAALSYFVHLANNRLDKYKAAKLMYLFDREMFLKTGMPAFFGEFFSLEHGPIVSEINDIMNSCSPDSLDTKYSASSFFSLDNNTLSVIQDLGDEYTRLLSEEERDVMNDLFVTFKNSNFGDLKRYMHSLPETIELENGKKREKITYFHFLKRNGFSDDQIDDILSEIEYEMKLRELISVK